VVYARSTSIQGDPGRVDEGIRFAREEVMPAVTGMDGCIGMSMLVNRDTGRCIVTSSWMSQDEMRGTESQVRALRSRAAEIMGGEVDVKEWEIAVMHREHETEEGSWCRVTWMQCEPAEVESMIDFFRDTVLTRLEGEDEFCSASFLVDRDTGRCCGTARFETRAGLESTREMALRMREERSATSSTRFTDILECELAIAHLRVPELV
jgi:heme-degrading monooxygenase HmoA